MRGLHCRGSACHTGIFISPSPRLWFYRRDTAVVKLLTGFSFISPVFARGGATRGPLHPLRGCPRAWALEWERWIRLRWLFGDSNTVVSSRWGLGGLRHFSGAFRPFRHSSRGLPSGSAIWCPSSLRCAEAHYSGFEGRASSKWLLGEMGSFCSAPKILGCWGFFCARLPPREASNKFL